MKHSPFDKIIAGGWCGQIRPRGPGVSATDDSIMAARHIGTSQCVRRWVGTSILPPLKVSRLLGRKLTVEENKDIAIAIASGGRDMQRLWCGAPVNVFNCK